MNASASLSGVKRTCSYPGATGSAPIANTIGIVTVAAFAASAAGVPLIAAITATLRSTKSAASAGSCSYWPAAQRYSIVLQETRTVPIIFTIVPDPVGSGFVESLSQPGGNASGFMQFEYSLSGKWLELLKQIAPNVTRAAILWNPTIPAGIGQFAVIQSVAPSLG